MAEFYDTYSAIENGLKSWDQTIFPDLQKLLFPGSDIEAGAIVEFKKSSYKTKTTQATVYFANFKDKAGNDLSIDYAYLMESIFISNNKDCLRKIIDYYSPIGEPINLEYL